MSRKDSKSKVESRSFDTQFSSGDCKEMSGNPKKQYKEENNNEVDELSKEFTDMGCIVDVVKRPPNICVEDCVYQGSESENEHCETRRDEDEDGYSDAFEECSEDDKEDNKAKSALDDVFKMDIYNNHLKAVKSEGNDITLTKTGVKLSKSQSFVSSKAMSRAGTSTSKYGSLPVPQTHRINMSFTNDRLRDIERQNHILLEKILSARNSRKSSIPPWQSSEASRQGPAIASAALCRKRQQRQIDRDNMILLRKIQQAKSTSSSLRR